MFTAGLLVVNYLIVPATCVVSERFYVYRCGYL